VAIVPRTGSAVLGDDRVLSDTEERLLGHHRLGRLHPAG